MQHVAEVATGIYQVQLPLPFPLRIVNCYVLADEDGWTLVDTGLNYADGRAGWLDAFAQLGIHSSAIRRIVLTHAHPDHYGMAGWLAQQSGAPVWLSAVDQQFVEQVWINGIDTEEHIGVFFRRHGVDAALRARVLQDMAQLRAMTTPHPVLRTLEPETTLRIGERQFELIATPGHSDGHLALFCAPEQLMLCGDTMLMKITPNIGLWPAGRPNPLSDFFTTLERLATMSVTLALPGHGPLITTFAQRAVELRDHHNERLETIMRAVGAGATAYTICTQVFPVVELSSHQLRFAMAETLAHLEYLVNVGRLKRSEDELILYHPV